MAGSDTTVTALRSIFLFIITQPHIYNTLRAEIAKAERSHLISNPIIRESEAKQLPYLQACIKEGLRFWPPVVGLMQKRVPDGGDTLNGQYVPGGTKIGYCGWGLQRRKDIFGEDVNLYRPERWLDVDEERLKRMERVTDLVFGSGKYGCLGKSIAMLELNKVFVEVLFELICPI